MSSSVILRPTAKHTASFIFLHGLGDTGHGWGSEFKYLQRPHIKYIFPTAPIRPVTINGGMKMNAWFDVLDLKRDSRYDEVGVKESSQSLLDLVQEEINSGIPSERIMIGGFSQGGATALYTTLTSSIKFAGVLALSTFLPLQNRFPDQLKAAESQFATPILQCHGDRDEIVSLEWAQASHDLIKKLGFTNIDLKVYKDLDHSASPEEMDHVDEFIDKHLNKI